MLATLIVVVLVVTTLYVGREILIPIAIAIPVSFVLSPPILLLRRWGLGRVPSVLTVVLAALVIAFSVSAVLTRQVSELAVDLPLYQATINAKLDDLRDAAADNALFAKVSAALKKLGEINPHRPAPSSVPAPSDQTKNRLTGGQRNQQPVPAEVHEPAWGPFAIVETIVELCRIRRAGHCVGDLPSYCYYGLLLSRFCWPGNGNCHNPSHSAWRDQPRHERGLGGQHLHAVATAAC